MITEIVVLLFRFLMLCGIQVAVLNNIQWSGYVNPYLYVLFILLLPVKFPKIPALFLAFILGVTIDMFTNTIGMHAAATVFMAFTRPFVLKLFAPRDGYDTDAVPGIRELGMQWWIAYSSVLVFVHHFALFYIEVFRFNEFFSTLQRALLSCIATVVLILISMFLSGKSKRER
jgi:hypothetical protein